MLQLNGISKSYTTGDFTQTALDSVSLNFRKSEFVAVLGPSGSGKTTLLNIVGGLDRYDSGDLVINGKSTKKFKDREWDAYRNNSVGFVFQAYNLIPHMNITDNVELGMTLSGVSGAQKHQKALAVLKRVGLSDHIHKKPNQLSGGQMQRVAIARALVNDPDIILADEPTGALDTQTSKQIMDLIKEVAKDKLVIMVTHNAELANRYADRVIQFSDGRTVTDSNPYSGKETEDGYRLKKTSMNFLTALKLSGKNIITKKWRTTLTAFASSIGIIGIALILSLSNGFHQQIDDYEAGTLSGFPVTVGRTAMTIDMNEMARRHAEANGTSSEDVEGKNAIYPYDSAEDRQVHTNVLTQEYIDYVEKLQTGKEDSLVSGISYTRMVNMNLLRKDGSQAQLVNTSSLNLSVYPTNFESESNYLHSKYDLLAGSMPESETDLLLILDEDNQLNIEVLEALGLDYEAESLSYDVLLGYEFKIIYNDDFYKKAGDYYVINGESSDLSGLYDSDRAITVKVAGIVRPNDEAVLTVLPEGIAYSDALAKHFIEDAKNSDIVKDQRSKDYNLLTGEAFTDGESGFGGLGGMGMGGLLGGSADTTKKEDVLAALGDDSIPTSIVIYPIDFSAKEEILRYLDQWNTDNADTDEDMIHYTDLAATVTEMASGIMDGITIVLIAFASISLVVSLIMIAIITYISVLERTREIGVLRALGARKKDITRVFDAETFIIGSLSGLLGILIAFLLTFPINSLLEGMTGLAGVAALNPLHAAGLVLLSISLTVLGGFIPAKMASKKDPVIALRAE